MANTLTLGTSAVRELDGLFSLNDLHTAAGGEAKHEPNQFTRLDQTQALIAEIKSADSRNCIETKRGAHGGTYACRELVIAYAAWISAAFHLKVIRVFLGQQVQTEAPSLKNRRWLVYFDHTGREVHQAVPNDAMVVSPKEIPGLLLDQRNGIFTAREVMEIAGHANLRMMTEVCNLEVRSQARKLLDEVKTFGTTDLTEIAKSAYLELSLRGEFQGVAA